MFSLYVKVKALYGEERVGCYYIHTQFDHIRHILV